MSTEQNRTRQHTDSARVMMRGDVLYSVRRFPVRLDNPGKFRWAVYRDGVFAGAARTLADAHGKINSGWFDLSVNPNA